MEIKETSDSKMAEFMMDGAIFYDHKNHFRDRPTGFHTI